LDKGEGEGKKRGEGENKRKGIKGEGPKRGKNTNKSITAKDRPETHAHTKKARPRFSTPLSEKKKEEETK